MLVADGVDGDAVRTLVERLIGEGAVPRLVGIAARQRRDRAGDELAVDATRGDRRRPCCTTRWRVPDGKDAAQALAAWGHASEFIKEQYRHCKPILLLGDARATAEGAGVPMKLPTGEEDPGLLVQEDGDAGAAMEGFIAAIAAHRHFARYADPPPV